MRSAAISGVVVAITLLAISTFQYAGGIHWSRVTVSLLCASELPSGEPNLGRGLSITALFLLCASMSLLFEAISRTADTHRQQKTIQIAGIGSMVYALLTATPMHDLMVNIALIFFLVALFGIQSMLYQRRRFGLVVTGIACIALKIFGVSLYYTHSYIEYWGVLQKLSFTLTTAWLFAVLLMSKPIANRDETKI